MLCGLGVCVSWWDGFIVSPPILPVPAGVEVIVRDGFFPFDDDTVSAAFVLSDVACD